MKIKAAVVHEKNGPFILEDVDLVEPSADELLVKVVASGICHTDEFGRSQGIPIPLPLVLGHEGAGIVEKVGENVKGFEVGDHVGFSYAFCDHCHSCMSGHPNYCDHFNDINFGGVAGDGKTKLFQNGKPVSMFFGQSSFATHSIINQKSAVKVDKDVDLAYVAPMGCGIQTGAGAVLNTIRPEMNSSIVIFGCGSVGMSAIMAAKVANCEKIIAVGGNPKSLELAKELGATHTINRKETDDIPAAVAAITGHGGADYAIDTSGYGPMIQTAIYSTRFHGKILPLAPSGVIEHFDIGTDVLMNMRSIIGVCEGDSLPQAFIPELVRLYKEGKFPIDKIITTYPFEDINGAFEKSHGSDVIKAVLRME